jgi:Homeodomain-like domain
MDLNPQRHRGHTGARLEQIKKAASLTLEGATIPEVAKELAVSQSTVRRLLAASEGLPTSYLSETAKVARLLDLDRCDHVLQEFFPLATGRERSPTEQSSPGEEISFNESLAAARIVLDVIKQRAKLIRYEEKPVINHRKLQVDVEELISRAV